MNKSKIINYFFPEPLPVVLMNKLTLLWIFIAILNALFLIVWRIDTGAPLYFPISIFNLSIDTDGILFSVIFLSIVSYALSKRRSNNIISVYVIGLLLLIVGNLAQGSFDVAFLYPISGGEGQYYHDAIEIGDWSDWIHSFNANQEYFVTHSRTHPPGAVLIEKIFMYGETALSISLIFSIISSISVVLIYKIFLVMGKEKLFASKIALLYAVVPAVNIYGIVSLDAVIATLFNMVLLGILILFTDDRKSYTSGFILVVLGLSLSSFITFASLFLWAMIIACALIALYKRRNIRVWHSFLSAFGIFVILALISNIFYNYDYLESFNTASRLENKSGFMLLASPLKYLVTRIEDVVEIALFLSVGLVSVLIAHNRYKYSDDVHWLIAASAIVILGLMFLTGAFKTGETARACLFIVSYFLIFMKDLNGSVLTSLITFAALQTIIMQQLGHYFW